MRTLKILLLSLCLTAPLAQAASVLKKEIYSENAYYFADKVLTQQLRLRAYYKNIPGLQPFVGLHFARDYQNPQTSALTQSFLAPSVGAVIPLYSVFYGVVEYRYLTLVDATSGFRTRRHDPRAGIYGYYARDLAKGTALTLQSETYGEIFEQPRLSWQPVYSLWTRVLLTDLLSQKISLSAYGELYGYESPSVDVGADRREARLGLTSRYYPLSSLSLQPYLYYGWKLKHAPVGGGWNFLLVLYGAFE